MFLDIVVVVLRSLAPVRLEAAVQRGGMRKTFLDKTNPTILGIPICGWGLVTDGYIRRKSGNSLGLFCQNWVCFGVFGGSGSGFVVSLLS
jgi:hypothetical protein